MVTSGIDNATRRHQTECLLVAQFVKCIFATLISIRTTFSKYISCECECECECLSAVCVS